MCCVHLNSWEYSEIWAQGSSRGGWSPDKGRDIEDLTTFCFHPGCWEVFVLDSGGSSGHSWLTARLCCPEAPIILAVLSVFRF